MSIAKHIVFTNKPRNGASNAPKNQPNVSIVISVPPQWEWKEEIMHKYYTATDLPQMECRGPQHPYLISSFVVSP